MNFSIIKLYLSNVSIVYLISGDNGDDDVFLVDKENRICGFFSLEHLKDFSIEHKGETYPFNIDELFSNNQLLLNEVISYSFIEAEDILCRNTKIEEIESEDAAKLIEVYNLISDFFYQINHEECLLLRKDINMEMFFDYCYYKYFWKQNEEWVKLEEKLKSFDYSEFVNIYKKLIHVFVSNIRIVE